MRILRIFNFKPNISKSIQNFNYTKNQKTFEDQEFFISQKKNISNWMYNNRNTYRKKYKIKEKFLK